MAEPFIGQVELYGFEFAPEKWARCEGQLEQINSNQALFSLIGTFYGGDGRSTFAIPDLRGKVAMSMGQHHGSQFDYKVGSTNGKETHTMTSQELAQHAHIASYTGTTGNLDVMVEASTEDGTSAVPSGGAVLSKFKPPGGGVDRPEMAYYGQTPPTGTTVELGGFSTLSGTLSGDVAVNSSGASGNFNIMQSGLVMNYSLALQGLFPSRS